MLRLYAALYSILVHTQAKRARDPSRVARCICSRFSYLHILSVHMYVYILCTCVCMYIFSRTNMCEIQYRRKHRQETPHGRLAASALVFHIYKYSSYTHTCTYIFSLYVCMYVYTLTHKQTIFNTGETHRQETSHRPQKSPVISGSFARNDLHLMAPYETSHTRLAAFALVCHKYILVIYTCTYIFSLCVCTFIFSPINKHTIFNTPGKKQARDLSLAARCIRSRFSRMACGTAAFRVRATLSCSAASQVSFAYQRVSLLHWSYMRVFIKDPLHRVRATLSCSLAS